MTTLTSQEQMTEDLNKITQPTLSEAYESEVRSYCRNFPEVFDTAKDSWLIGREGNRYLDFFAGAGVLNYGHNNEKLKRKLIEYIERDGITHSLDMYSYAKEKFIDAFHSIIMKPRGMDYKLQFPGPTGTNAVEAALKLARKVTGREGVISFTNSFHGMTIGSLSVTGNGFKRKGAGVALSDTSSMPFDGYMGEDVDTLEYLNAMLEDDGSGMDKPAAVILETVQAEGGVNVASTEWLQRLRKITREHDVLMIVDDIQVGCGRTGNFFSFEESGIKPDFITLSKSLSGFGLPFALVLIKPRYDQWEPGEHNGTFRGHNPAFITGAAALHYYWKDDVLTRDVKRKAKFVREELQNIIERQNIAATIRGRGLIIGVEFDDIELADNISKACFDRELVIETAGIDGQVLKLLPPLTVTDEELKQGLSIIEEALNAVLQSDAEEVETEVVSA